LSYKEAMKTFVAKTKREKYLLRLLWPAVEQMEKCLFDHLPPATSEEQRIDSQMIWIRKKIPLFHKRISKMRFKRMSDASKRVRG